MSVCRVGSEMCIRDSDCILKIVGFFFQAEDGIRDFCLSRGLGDVYKRQPMIKPVTKPCRTATP